jgi:hypothetical protein
VDNVIRFPGVTRLDMDPDTVLQEAVGKLSGVVITGHTHDGHEYFASSWADGGDALWALERCKMVLLSSVDDLAGDE